MREAIRDMILLAAVIWLTGCAAQTIRLWEKGDASKDPGVLCVEERPACNANAVVLDTSRMPAPGQGPYEAEKVIELSEGGQVLRTWYMPVDEIVLGVEGKHILTGLGNREIALKIGLDRFIDTAPVPQNKGTWVDCPPAAEREFPDSAFLKCSRYEDLKTGEKRVLAFQEPCK